MYFVVLYGIVLYFILFWYIVFFLIVLYCIVLYYIVLYCIVLYCIVLYCIILFCVLCYFNALYGMSLHGIVWYGIVLYFSDEITCSFTSILGAMLSLMSATRSMRNIRSPVVVGVISNLLTTLLYSAHTLGGGDGGDWGIGVLGNFLSGLFVNSFSLFVYFLCAFTFFVCLLSLFVYFLCLFTFFVGECWICGCGASWV